MEKRNKSTITTGVYHLDNGELFLKGPFEITEETEKCYYTRWRFRKADIGKVELKGLSTSSPWIAVSLVDADETQIRKALASWFTSRAEEILNPISLDREA